MDKLFDTSSDLLSIGVYPSIPVVRGSVIGGKDKLPDVGSPIISVVQVYSAIAQYQDGTDYTVSGNYIQWGGKSEPPTGGTYYVSVTTTKKSDN